MNPTLTGSTQHTHLRKLNVLKHPFCLIRACIELLRLEELMRDDRSERALVVPLAGHASAAEYGCEMGAERGLALPVPPGLAPWLPYGEAPVRNPFPPPPPL